MEEETKIIRWELDILCTLESSISS